MNGTVDEVITQIKSTEDFFEKAKLILHLQKDIELPLKDIAEKLNFNTIKKYSNAMLPLTGLVGIMLLNSQKLVDIGNLASRIQRIEVVAGITIILAVYIIIFVKIANKEKCA